MVKVVVAGCARGATRWAYEAIKRAGHEVSFCSVFHEHSSSQNAYAGVAKSPRTVEVSWFAAPFIKHPALENVKVVRLCRDPLATVNSLCWSGIFHPGRNDLIQGWYHFISRHVKDIDQWYRNKPGQSAMYYLCEWYALMADAECSVRAEDGAKALLEACGLENKTGVYYDNFRVNSSACRSIATGENIKQLLISERFRELADDLGYVLDEEQSSKCPQSEIWHV